MWPLPPRSSALSSYRSRGIKSAGADFWGQMVHKCPPHKYAIRFIHIVGPSASLWRKVPRLFILSVYWNFIAICGAISIENFLRQLLLYRPAEAPLRFCEEINPLKDGNAQKCSIMISLPCPQRTPRLAAQSHEPRVGPCEDFCAPAPGRVASRTPPKS